MLTPNDITAAVSTAVRGLFPGETVHENLVPRSFPRPCNMVELTGIALGEVSPGGVELLYTYRITDFVEVDERHNSQLSKLDLRTMETLANAIKFVCTAAPTTAFPLKLEVTR